MAIALKEVLDIIKVADKEDLNILEHNYRRLAHRHPEKKRYMVLYKRAQARLAEMPDG